ncbi:DUF881 domain-containing protein [uncultured Friedmanniella sp.]|uniref:DUF881 domain-containing protein n=1 Tax=uncultured Friedmanniella sp. TaxID=335381 RepID=UPI0035C9FF39
MTAPAPAATPAKPAPRPPDASMDLLRQIVRQSVDPDYAVAAARGSRSSRHHWLLGAVAVLVGVLFAVAALQTTRSAPAVQTERSELITRVQDAETAQDQLRSRATTLSEDISTLRAAALGDDAGSQALQRRISLLDPVVGLIAVHGPGVSVVVDDAPSADDERDRVLDLDLQILANGLWQAGAEAIAVNGHRLSGLTAIRSAGDAITVDYRSLTPPYRIEAVGDPQTLPAAFAETAAGAWWHDLAQNRGMRFDLTTTDDLTLPADPGLTLRYAKEPR